MLWSHTTGNHPSWYGHTQLVTTLHDMVTHNWYPAFMLWSHTTGNHPSWYGHTQLVPCLHAMVTHNWYPAFMIWSHTTGTLPSWYGHTQLVPCPPGTYQCPGPPCIPQWRPGSGTACTTQSVGGCPALPANVQYSVTLHESRWNTSGNMSCRVQWWSDIIAVIP